MTRVNRFQGNADLQRTRELLRRTVNSEHLHRRGPFSLREKDRMRAGFTVACPHPIPLPQGEGEKQYALFDGWISMLLKKVRPGEGDEPWTGPTRHTSEFDAGA